MAFSGNMCKMRNFHKYSDSNFKFCKTLGIILCETKIYQKIAMNLHALKDSGMHGQREFFVD